MSAPVSMKDLLEAGIHFGHQTRRWNPKMRRYIWGERAGIYIVDLVQTQRLFEEATNYIGGLAAKDKTIMFVGTKKQAQDPVADAANSVNQPYVNHRWLGGLLTNWETISKRLQHMQELRRQREQGQLDLLGKKERLTRLLELAKLEQSLGGMAGMTRLPDAIVIVDLNNEALAVKEARRLKIPIIALVDTNADPDLADYVVPGDDDAIRSCTLFLETIATAISEAKQMVTPEEFAAEQEEAVAPAAAEVTETPAETAETPETVEAPAATEAPATV
ncbi:MAG: ribosomal protein [Thermoleophilia bacterium]|nr:ribosomal protein [Thermoleophilia bacterium]